MRFDDAQPDPRLASFCEEQWPRLVGTLRFLVADAAEDLAQDALARACQHWGKVSQLEMPGAWLHKVAINLARSHARRAAVRSRLRPMSKTMQPETTDPTTLLWVRQQLDALPERERLALVLRYFADFSVKDTATVMGCADGTVKFLTHSALRRIRATVLAKDETQEADDARRS